MAVANRKERRRLKRLEKKSPVAAHNGAAKATRIDTLLHRAVDQHKAGQLAGALQLYRDVLALNPKEVNALNLGGLITSRLGDPEEGVQMLRAAVSLNPNYAEAHSNLGNVLQVTDRNDEAAAAYRRATELKPDYTDAHYNLGIVLRQSGDSEGAIAAFRRATECDPDSAPAFNNLGAMLQNTGDLEQAAVLFRRATEINPNYPSALSNMGAALLCYGKFDETIYYCHRALDIDPNHTKSLSNLGLAMQNLGRLDEAFEAFNKALALDPTFSSVHSNLIFCMNYEPSFTGEDILAESRRWEAIHAAPLAGNARPHANPRDPERRLRVGYVSPDFRQHAVKYFLEPLLAAHDRTEVEIFCYAEVARPDDVTARFQMLADGWRWTVDMSDAALTERIRADGIDILVDLAGHTASSRLLTFAARPAPIQVSWLGYPNTTGLSAVDYRLTDAIADPEGRADSVHSETLVRLAECFLCYAPPADAPPVSSLPAAANSHITFGSFNNLAKITSEMVQVWAAILDRVPGARLLLKSRLLSDEAARKRYQDMFAAHGIGAGRVELISAIPSISGHLGAYERVDIALDSFPYNGTTTTCEALWMGVPVVTLLGDRHAGRVSATLLSAIGLPELAAENKEAYIETAVKLAGDLDRLSALRHELRPRMATAPLCDAPSFARKMETAFRDMWCKWCAETAVEEPSSAFEPPVAIESPAIIPTAVPEAATKPKIRVLHHMARTGGTVICKCLASMDAVMLLSEIHPRGVTQFNPLNQAVEWFSLLSGENLKQLQGKPLNFAQTIDLIRRGADERGKELVIRDWTHLDFTAVPFLPERSYRLTTAEELRADFDVIHTASVRHPIDQWLSLSRLAVMAGKLELEDFLRDCRRFAEAAREIGFVRYEDFTRDPDTALQDLCRSLDLPFDPGYRERWKEYRNITGDVSPNVTARDIAPGKRRPMEPGLFEKFAANEDYRATIEILGYEHQ